MQMVTDELGMPAADFPFETAIMAPELHVLAKQVRRTSRAGPEHDVIDSQSDHLASTSGEPHSMSGPSIAWTTCYIVSSQLAHEDCSVSTAASRQLQVRKKACWVLLPDRQQAWLTKG